MNLYRYVNNHPCNTVDSNGEDSERRAENYKDFMDTSDFDMPVDDFADMFNKGQGMTEQQYELFKQGCQGLAMIRVGIGFQSAKRGTRAFTSYSEAKWYYDQLADAGRAPQMVAIQTGAPYENSSVPNRLLLGITEINPNQIDLSGTKNYATLQKTLGGALYWEYVTGSWLNNPSNRANCRVVHSPTLPMFTTTTYFVVPGNSGNAKGQKP